MRTQEHLSLLFALSIAASTGCATVDTDPVAHADDETASEPAQQVTESARDPGGQLVPYTPQTPAAQVTTLPGAQLDWEAGDYPPNLKAPEYLTIEGLPNQGDRKRQYKVHVPKGYDKNTPAPVLFAFHGLMQSPLLFPINGSNFVQKSDQEGFILVMAAGVQEEAFGLGGSWNAGTCCGATANQRVDDVGFVRAIFARLHEHLNVDDARVYATGMSNGGYLSFRLGCEAADIFAAIAPVAGAVGTKEVNAFGTNPNPDFAKCAPSQPVAVLAVHGEADPIVPYAVHKPSLEQFARANGCQTATRPATQPASAGESACVTYDGCKDGFEVTGCSVKSGGHCWFGDPSCGTGAAGIGNLFVGNNSKDIDTSDAVWKFVSRFRRQR